MNHPRHVGSICATLGTVCVCVCVSFERWGLLLRDTPHHTPPCLLLYKREGGKGTFVTLLPDAETIPLSLDTHIPQGRTDYPDKGASSLRPVTWVPPSGGSETEGKSIKFWKKKKKKKNPNPTCSPSSSRSHEDLQPALPHPAGDRGPRSGLRRQTG